MTRDRSDGGFTLIELLIALMIGGVAALLANRTFSAAVDGVRTLRMARIAADRSANAHRWLAAAFLSVDLGTDEAAAFEGLSDHLAFSSRLLTERGWRERKTVLIERRGAELVALAGDGAAILLADDADGVAFDYLLEPGADAQWVQRWTSPASAPLAIRVRLARRASVDTALYLIRARG